MFTIFAGYIFECSIISYNFLYFGIRHLGSAILNYLDVFILLNNLIDRGSRNTKLDWCIEELFKGEMNDPVMKYRFFFALFVVCAFPYMKITHLCFVLHQILFYLSYI